MKLFRRRMINDRKANMETAGTDIKYTIRTWARVAKNEISYFVCFMTEVVKFKVTS